MKGIKYDFGFKYGAAFFHWRRGEGEERALGTTAKARLGRARVWGHVPQILTTSSKWRTMRLFTLMAHHKF